MASWSLVHITLVQYYEAVHILETKEVAILTLDHDLGEDVDGVELPNGYDLVKYFCEHGLRADKIYIHTDNPRTTEYV
ncbi:hypothetical protein PAEAM_56600 [Paenibacillus sp. GM1FR]|uniref:cyclic-phosphate processing receiver domain-containing protein n=1 Tax=Paenibacillus sp. GM1FR TaxID=2059267 RepID=UPI000CA8F4DF|nr:hypothetical protein PAEAM_56600 [Paenibacillus sp. GM1FR]